MQSALALVSISGVAPRWPFKTFNPRDSIQPVYLGMIPLLSDVHGIRVADDSLMQLFRHLVCRLPEAA